MLTLRAIPPRLLTGKGPASCDLAADYFAGLWRHWGPRDRSIALLLAGTQAVLHARGSWRHGWGLAEQQLLAAGADADAHLGMAARKGVHRLLNPGAFPFEANPLKNKHLYAKKAAAAGLPVPASWDGATPLADWLAGEQAVIAKPNYSSKGKGVIGFRRDGDRWAGAGETLPTAAVAERLAAMARDGAVIQRLHDTHPDLLALSPGALPSLRVMTCVNEQGAIEPCGVVLRLSAGGPRPVDNFNAGNIVVAVDAEGRCGRAFRRARSGLTALCQHPVSGARIGGTALPDVAASVALAIRAHEAFREGFRVIGWDVGLTPQGPLLLEGNWNPGTDILQLVSGEGLGTTRLGALYRHHLAALTPEEWRAARPIEREPVRASR